MTGVFLALCDFISFVPVYCFVHNVRDLSLVLIDADIMPGINCGQAGAGFIMITSEEKKTICDISEKYRAKLVLLFGSSLVGAGHDIDLAVEGVLPSKFYDFYGELMFALTKPVDLIDLAGTSKFVEMVRKEGVPLYG
jgi:predicted nucleotidyltransferase